MTTTTTKTQFAWRRPEEVRDEFQADFEGCIGPNEPDRAYFERKKSEPGGWYFARFTGANSGMVDWFGNWHGTRWKAVIRFHRHESGVWMPHRDGETMYHAICALYTHALDTLGAKASAALKGRVLNKGTRVWNDFVIAHSELWVDAMAKDSKEGIERREGLILEFQADIIRLTDQIKSIDAGETVEVIPTLDNRGHVVEVHD